ncbi:MAG TPA: 4a-hydroxytetrahydrobiopterin dehydratase [Burkholderiales bacterium]|nr:4a-hydroxytetrahydrobiopterin dehydratase [Burkholderiales bacterium]
MSEISEGLRRKKCAPCEGGTAPMTPAQIGHFLKGLAGWEYADGRIRKTFRFANYHEAVAFVNATAWISHREDHHPDIALGYNQATVAYMTHAIGGISENDFICATKIDALFEL